MRLSRPRVLLRVVLLAILGCFLLWKAWSAHVAASTAAGTAEGLLRSRIALLEGVMGLLGLVTAALALLALARRRQAPTLRLRDPVRDRDGQ